MGPLKYPSIVPGTEKIKIYKGQPNLCVLCLNMNWGKVKTHSLCFQLASLKICPGQSKNYKMELETFQLLAVLTERKRKCLHEEILLHSVQVY